jgi:hypothetical protein
MSGKINIQEGEEGEVNNANLGRIVNLMQYMVDSSLFRLTPNVFYLCIEAIRTQWLSDSGSSLQFLHHQCDWSLL